MTKAPSPRTPKIIGLGRFASGVTDLATNPKYMMGFGEKGLDRAPTKGSKIPRKKSRRSKPRKP
jgi:hypothetical protein